MVSGKPPTETHVALSRLSLQLLAAVTRELRDAAGAFQGPTETPAEAGQRATRLRKAVELATEALNAVDGSLDAPWSDPVTGDEVERGDVTLP